MAANKPLEPGERQRIVDLLHEHGGNRSQVASQTGRSKGLVAKIAKQEGIESVNVHATKKATEASMVINEALRVEAANLILEVGIDYAKKLKQEEPTPENTRAYKDVATALGIGVDKNRLESGEVTYRTESRSGANLEEVFNRIDSKFGL